MVSHPKTPILNCLYHLLWFYFLTVPVIICVWPNSYVPHS